MGGKTGRDETGRDEKLTTHLHPMPRLMRGAISPLTNISSWRGA